MAELIIRLKPKSFSALAWMLSLKGSDGMRVYELMSALASLPSGAEVICAVTLTTGELVSGNDMGTADTGDIMYSVSKELTTIDSDSNSVCLGF